MMSNSNGSPLDTQHTPSRELGARNSISTESQITHEMTPSVNGASRLYESRTISNANENSGRREPGKDGKEKEPDSDDGIIWVDWDGPRDLQNPRNWPNKRKWKITLTMSVFNFITPIASSMVAPTSSLIAQDFGTESTVLIAMITSVFVLGFAFGPLILGPLSEIYGRSHVLQLSNLFFLAWNLGCGFAQNRDQLIGFRLMAGLGGSAPLSVGGGLLGDLWRPEERGRAVAIYSLAPLLGPVIGPVYSGWIAERSMWRWVFWSSTIADAVIQLAGIALLEETYAPVLLDRKAKHIRRQQDEEKGPHKRVLSVYDAFEDRSWKHIFTVALTRPFQLFCTEPIIQVLGIYMAFVYGIYYLFLTTIPEIFREVYHERPGIGGLNYIAIGVGVTLTSQTNARLMDKIYIYFKKKHGNIGKPEYRLPSMFPGTFMLPFGLLLTGWSAQNRLHWIATDVGIACVGSGMILVFQSMQIYIVDAFTLYAASALAAVSFLRSLAGFGFPLFAPAMYHKVGYGKGDTILATLAIGLGCPAPILLWKYGERIRQRSRYTNIDHPLVRHAMGVEEEKPESTTTEHSIAPSMSRPSFSGGGDASTRSTVSYESLPTRRVASSISR